MAVVLHMVLPVFVPFGGVLTQPHWETDVANIAAAMGRCSQHYFLY